jgi:PAS domain S-box-containing protein
MPETSSKLYRELFELGPTPTAVFDIEGNLVMANRALAHHLGYGPQLLRPAGLGFRELFWKPESGEKLRRELQERGAIERWKSKTQKGIALRPFSPAA